jgi:hypothetical protein
MAMRYTAGQAAPPIDAASSGSLLSSAWKVLVLVGIGVIICLLTPPRSIPNGAVLHYFFSIPR